MPRLAGLALAGLLTALAAPAFATDVIPVVAGTSHPTKEISFKPLDAKDAKTF